MTEASLHRHDEYAYGSGSLASLPSIEVLQSRLDSQQKSGKLKESVVTMEQLVHRLREKYTDQSTEFANGVEKLCQLHNLVAMRCLEKEAFDECLESLRKAESLQHNSDKMRAVSFNNMACYYRRRNKLRTALNYLLSALSIELRLDETEVSLADTHINLCAVLSQLDRHAEALEHSMLSVIMLQDEMLRKTLLTNNQKQAKSQQQQHPHESESEQEEDKQSVATDRIAVLTIAYHNLGVEFEHLKRDDECMKLYAKSHEMARTYLGPDHSVAKKLEIILDNAKQERLERRQKAEEKAMQADIQNGFIYNERSRGGEDSTMANLSYKKSLSKALPKLRLQSSPKSRGTKQKKAFSNNNGSMYDETQQSYPNNNNNSNGSNLAAHSMKRQAAAGEQESHLNNTQNNHHPGRTLKENSRIHSVDQRSRNTTTANNRGFVPFDPISVPSKSVDSRSMKAALLPLPQESQTVAVQQQSRNRGSQLDRNTIDVVDGKHAAFAALNYRQFNETSSNHNGHNSNQNSNNNHEGRHSARQMTSSSSRDRLVGEPTIALGFPPTQNHHEENAAMNSTQNKLKVPQNQQNNRRTSMPVYKSDNLGQPTQKPFLASVNINRQDVQLPGKTQHQTQQQQQSFNKDNSNNLYRVEPEAHRLPQSSSNRLQQQHR